MTGYFDEKGPRQLPGLDYGPVARSYEALVAMMSAAFPAALIFSSNPAARRSAHGFAIRRAMTVTNKLKKMGANHHHFSVLRKFHGRRTGSSAESGGRFPLKEEYFEDDGVRLIRAALSGVFVRSYALVRAVLQAGGLVDADGIDGLKFIF